MMHSTAPLKSVFYIDFVFFWKLTGSWIYLDYASILEAKLLKILIIFIDYFYWFYVFILYLFIEYKICISEKGDKSKA